MKSSTMKFFNTIGYELVYTVVWCNRATSFGFHRTNTGPRETGKWQYGGWGGGVGVKIVISGNDCLRGGIVSLALGRRLYGRP
jgi:hypothetical protein